MEDERKFAGNVAAISPREKSMEQPLGNLDLSRLGLKITEHSKDIIDLYEEYDTSILITATGTGKTIGLPPILLKHNPNARIVETEPRNAPMYTTASYLSELLGDKLGGLVGVRYKGSGRHWGDRTRIMIEMEQSLTNEYKEDPLLMAYNIAIFDEAHEGGLRNRILLSLALDAQAKRKAQGLEPLKIILTTATFDAESLQEKLGKDKTGKLEIPGPPPFYINKKYSSEFIPIEDRPKYAALEVKKIITDPEANKGDILIFLPGRPEINKTKAELKKLILTGNDFEILTLDSTTSQEQKDEISNKVGGKRRVILSTNSGETGITFPEDLFYMIDTGLIKNTKIDKDTGMQYLVTEEHSWSGCIQRDGRLGRNGEGEARHLYKEESLEERERENKYGEPEVNRVELAPYLLELLGIGIKNVRQFPFIDKPDPLHMEQALTSLKRLGAINEKEEITEIGNEMLKKQTDIHLARMMVEGERRNLSRITNTLADLAGKSQSLIKDQKKLGPLRVPGSDFLTLLNIYREFLHQPDKRLWPELVGLDAGILSQIAKNHKEFDGSLIDSEAGIETLGQCIAAGFKDQILELQSNNSYKFLSNPNHSNIKIDFNSQTVNSSQQYLCMAKIRKDKNGQTLAQLCHEIKKEWIENILEKVPEPPILKPEQKTLPPPPEKIKEVVKNRPAASAPAVSSEAQSKPVVKAGKTENVSIVQRLKNAWKSFVNFLKKLFRK